MTWQIFRKTAYSPLERARIVIEDLTSNERGDFTFFGALLDHVWGGSRV